MLVPLGADGCLVFVGCDLYLTGGAPLSELYFIFLFFIFSHLHCCGEAKGTPPSAALECYGPSDIKIEIICFGVYDFSMWLQYTMPMQAKCDVASGGN
jgi:hypothetical protein